jgi:hypothetical protein
MKHILLLLGSVAVTQMAMGQSTSSEGLESSMTVDEVLKLQPYDALKLNKQMDIQANKLEYIDRELKIAEKLAKLREVNGEINKKPVPQQSPVRAGNKSSKKHYSPVKLISIWVEDDGLVGLFLIGKTKIRLAKGESFNGYSVKEINNSSVRVSRPKGGDIKLGI